MSYAPRKPSRVQCLIYPGILLLIGSLCLTFLWPNLYKFIVNSQLGFTPNSKIFHVWRKSATKSYLEIYLHNWTNPHDGHNASIKPKFEEIGPFKFREIKEKVNITWNSNYTITYRQKKTWWFDESGSCCKLDTNITSLNAILVAMSHKSRDWNIFSKVAMSGTLRALSPDLHVTKSARELLFDGYVDHLLGVSKSLGVGISPSDRFGWFFPKNGSSLPDGLFNMDISGEFRGTIKKWNGWTQTPYYNEECSNVFGSAGELYAPKQNRHMASFFSPDMCRNVPLDYERDVSIFGLTGHRYIAYNSLLDNGTLYPENKCYCNGDCMPSGILNVSSCRAGSPTYLSLPHFLHADPVYTDNIVGLQPDKDKHQLFIVLEPNTGLPLQAAARVQLNMHLKPIDYMSLINDVPNVMFPIFWFQVETHPSEEFANALKMLLSLPKILKSVALILVLASLIIIAIGFYTKKRKIKDPMISREQVPLQSTKDVY